MDLKPSCVRVRPHQIGATTTGYLKVVVSAEMVGAGVDEDGMTAVSGLTGLHSLDGSYEEQDLSGGWCKCI